MWWRSSSFLGQAENRRPIGIAPHWTQKRALRNCSKFGRIDLTRSIIPVNAGSEAALPGAAFGVSGLLRYANPLATPRTIRAADIMRCLRAGGQAFERKGAHTKEAPAVSSEGFDRFSGSALPLRESGDGAGLTRGKISQARRGLWPWSANYSAANATSGK